MEGERERGGGRESLKIEKEEVSMCVVVGVSSSLQLRAVSPVKT